MPKIVMSAMKALIKDIVDITGNWRKKMDLDNNTKIKIQIAIMLLIGILFFTFVIPNIKASLGSFKQNDCVDIKTILNSTYVNISTLSYPNSTIILQNKEMTKNGFTFNYTFCNTNTLGKYIYDYFDESGNVYVNDFEITSTGEKVSLSNIIIVIVFLFLATLFFILGYTFNQEKYLMKSFFYLSALLMGLIAVNSGRIIASESLGLSKMSDLGFIMIIPVISVFFLYVFISWTIETFKSFKKKEMTRWSY